MPTARPSRAWYSGTPFSISGTFTPIVGSFSGVGSPSFDFLEGATLKVAVAHGTANARRVMEDIKAGGKFSECHFIEFMACPGGCLGGGGQPIPTSPEIRAARANAQRVRETVRVLDLRLAEGSSFAATLEQERAVNGLERIGRGRPGTQQTRT